MIGYLTCHELDDILYFVFAEILNQLTGVLPPTPGQV